MRTLLPENAGMFPALRAYSPVHNVVPGGGGLDEWIAAVAQQYVFLASQMEGSFD